MKRILGFAGGLLAFSALLAHSSGCSDDPAPATTTPDGGGGTDAPTTETGGATTPLAEPATPCADAVDAIYGDPGPLTADPASRGKILKCNKGADITKEAMQAELTRVGYSGKPISTGAHVYKVLFQTTRGDVAGSAAASSALVYVPIVQRAEKLPIVVAARGSRGQTARCAVSKLDPTLSGYNDDAYRLMYALAGHGYAVIVPDLAGYANFGAPGNPPAAYAQAADVGRSTLDGSRALKKLYPQLDDKTVIVGHSQGGHSALAALSLVDSYGAQGTLVGVATYAPLWLSQRTWGAIIDAPVAIDRNYTIADSRYANASAVAIWYHYTQAELLDGPGEGIKLFKPEKQDVVKKFIAESCFGDYKILTDNAKFAYEFFPDAFWQSVGDPAAGIGQCAATDTLCAKWIGRYTADRPHLTGAAATTPILVLYSGDDKTIVPNRMACAIERLKQDAVKMEFCYEPAAGKDTGHQTIMNTQGERVADWVASLTLGTAAPAPCAVNETGVATSCEAPPPND